MPPRATWRGTDPARKTDGGPQRWVRECDTSPVTTDSGDVNEGEAVQEIAAKREDFLRLRYCDSKYFTESFDGKT